MRDPARIDKFLSLLAKVWKNHPDLRFFQLLHWIFSIRSRGNTTHFSTEDNEIEAILIKWMDEHGET